MRFGNFVRALSLSLAVVGTFTVPQASKAQLLDALQVAPQGAPAAPAKAELTDEIKKAVLEGVSRVVKNNAFVPGVDLNKWDEFLAANKADIDAAKNDTEFAAAVRKAFTKFGISHIGLMTPQAARARIERSAVGIGITVQPGDDGLTVTAVFDGSPAKEAGFEPGDLIMEADGQKLGRDSTITGDEGTQVELKVKKRDGNVKTMKLTRRKYSNARVDTITWPSPDTAVIKIHSFDVNYNRQKVDDLLKEARKAKNVVVDLRSNGGGAVINMLHFIGYFLSPDEQFGVFINRQMVRQFVDETKGSPTELRKIAMRSKRGWLRGTRPADGPLSANIAVLINGGSGSASEITAQALKEFRDASVVGTKSAGAVLVSTMAQVSNGWVMQFPLSDYISAQGVRLEGNGIEPEIVAEMPKFGEPDTAIEKAMALLKRAELRNQRAGTNVPK